MGFQQSYIKFESKEKLNEELMKYWKRDKEEDAAVVIGVVVAKRGLQSWGIEKNEALLVLSGARYLQRIIVLEEELGIKADRVIFIDSFYPIGLLEDDGKDLHKFIDDTFTFYAFHEEDVGQPLVCYL